MPNPDDVTKKEPGPLVKVAKVVKEKVIQPVAAAVGLTPAEPKAPTKSERKASRKAAVAAAHPDTK
jgi:hypothetical protein